MLTRQQMLAERHDLEGRLADAESGVGLWQDKAEDLEAECEKARERLYTLSVDDRSVAECVRNVVDAWDWWRTFGVSGPNDCEHFRAVNKTMYDLRQIVRQCDRAGL